MIINYNFLLHVKMSESICVNPITTWGVFHVVFSSWIKNDSHHSHLTNQIKRVLVFNSTMINFTELFILYIFIQNAYANEKVLKKRG